MRSIGHDDWEDDEPPMLGEDTDNQAADASRKPQDASVMDEMLAVAQRAKEDKRKQQESERNRKSFGQGLRKGFFNTKAKPSKEKTPQSTSAVLEPTRQQARDERLLIVKEKQEEAATTSPAFVFPEVQEAMKSMNQLDPKEWMNERFFEKLARNPRLAQALQNPAFSTAIAEMQQDPQAAVLKYQKDPAVSTMLRDFMEFLGNHFEELGASEEAASPQRSATQRQQAVGRDLRVDNNNQTPSAASTPPTIVDLDETRRQAIAGMQRTPEEEEQVQRILKNPELLAALSDGSLMQRLHACQQSPGELQRLAQDPVLGPKLRLLVQHNMVQFAA